MINLTNCNKALYAYDKYTSKNSWNYSRRTMIIIIIWRFQPVRPRFKNRPDKRNMDSSAWIICLLLAWMRISNINCHAVMKRDSPSSRGAGVAPQTCGTDNFYCPYAPSDRSCKPRSQRCSGSNICNNPTTMKEEDCSETSIPGEYYVLLGHAKLFDSSSKKRSIKAKLEHPFGTFRGFTYEFGKSYGVQVLDIADPIYKYKNGKHLNSRGIQQIGRSYCNRKDANMVVQNWKSAKYKLFRKNCQHFADAMADILIDSPCNRPAASRGSFEAATRNTLGTRLVNVKIMIWSLPSILIDSCEIVLLYSMLLWCFVCHNINSQFIFIGGFCVCHYD